MITHTTIKRKKKGHVDNKTQYDKLFGNNRKLALHKIFFIKECTPNTLRYTTGTMGILYNICKNNHIYGTKRKVSTLPT